MTKLNSIRDNCKDVYNAHLVASAHYSGMLEFPNIQGISQIPNRLIAFSKAISCSDFDQWVHFYEDDYLFERLWRNPNRYLELLKRYNGVILPDFSLYRDMPLVMQFWNIYRSRAIGNWLQLNGVAVIANIRYADRRTYEFCCDGISSNSTIAIGTYGTIKNKEDRYFFCEGLSVVVKILSPKNIVVYGSAPSSIFGEYEKAGIKIVSFENNYWADHMEKK